MRESLRQTTASKIATTAAHSCGYARSVRASAHTQFDKPEASTIYAALTASPPHSRHRLGFWLALLGAIASSGKAIVVKLLLREGIDPITSLGLRMLFAGPVFAALAVWGGRGNSAEIRPRLGRVVLLGFTGYYLASTLDFLGLQLISASLERLILYVYPTLVLLFWRWRGGPRIRARQWMAMLISYVGVLLAFGSEASRSLSQAAGAPHDVLLGSTLVLIGSASYALYIVLSGELVGSFGALRLTGLASGVATVLCVGQFLILRAQLLPRISHWLTPRVLGLSLLNASVCTVMPMWMVMRGIQLVGAGEAAQIGMIGPLATLLLAALLLGETFSVPMMLGTCLVLLGIWWLSRR